MKPITNEKKDVEKWYLPHKDKSFQKTKDKKKSIIIISLYVMGEYPQKKNLGGSIFFCVFSFLNAVKFL